MDQCKSWPDTSKRSPIATVHISYGQCSYWLVAAMPAEADTVAIVKQFYSRREFAPVINQLDEIVYQLAIHMDQSIYECPM